MSAFLLFQRISLQHTRKREREILHHHQITNRSTRFLKFHMCFVPERNYHHTQLEMQPANQARCIIQQLLLGNTLLTWIHVLLENPN